MTYTLYHFAKPFASSFLETGALYVRKEAGQQNTADDR